MYPNINVPDTTVQYFDTEYFQDQNAMVANTTIFWYMMVFYEMVFSVWRQKIIFVSRVMQLYYTVLPSLFIQNITHKSCFCKQNWNLHKNTFYKTETVENFVTTLVGNFVGHTALKDFIAKFSDNNRKTIGYGFKNNNILLCIL